MDTIMQNTNDTVKQRFRHTSILNEAAAAPKTAITFTEIIEISSNDGSSEESSNGDNDQESVDRQLLNNAKQSDEKQSGRADNLTPVEGFVDKRAIRSNPRVQGGKISKTNKDGKTVQKVVLCRPDSSVAPTRPDQLHHTKPQCKDAKSGRGQIPEYYGSRASKRVQYSDRSLNSRVLPKHKTNPHGHYSQRNPNLPCLPFILQITILRSLQTALESMCYRFVQKWLPKMLLANTWECPENVELNLWLTQVAIDSIKAMIEDALEIAHIFRDDIFVPKFELWKEKIEYCLEVDRKASGRPIMVRRLDAINAMRKDNASNQDKLQKEIFALKAELLEKEQKVERLQREYVALVASETDTMELARNGGKLGIEETKHLGDFKALEECFTLNFDRNAPNPEPAENFSGDLIMLSAVGSLPGAGSRGGPIANWGIRLEKNARLMPGNSRVDTNGPINGQSRIHNPTVSHGTGMNGLPSRPEPIARNAYGTPMNVTDSAGLGPRTASGQVSTSHTGQPIPAAAVVVDLTKDDDEIMVE
ncbi:uncharacterized protein EAE98_003126 [Botrytis deweyae]|uniref:BZIP domain-containing protein n=1 Tax=Botrytis deweyae TaxID=2478750 RepID=A0ABQ7IW15_9HELO|nr:uncharacterized protein EAE98_003126 [Botrytis deweyae]KAF7935081.1 hypothetical protein EAE98_003126 [Botrytis deweyae]